MDGKRELPLVARMIALAIETRHELKIFPTCWEWWHSFTYSWNKVTLHLFWMHCTTITFDKVKLINWLTESWLPFNKKHLQYKLLHLNNLEEESPTWSSMVSCKPVNETDGGFIVARFHSQSAPPGGRVSAFKSNRFILESWVVESIKELSNWTKPLKYNNSN